jgi:hypothetical protein
MIYHQVRIELRKDVSEAQKNEGIAKLHQMGREIESVKSYCVGKDVGANFDIGALYVIENIEAYRHYMNHPIHKEMDRIGLPLVKDMISQDLTDDPDPAIAFKIKQIHVERYTGDQELTQLVKGLDSYQGSGTPE